MKSSTVAACRFTLLVILTPLFFTTAWAEDTPLPREKLASIFPKAANFVEKTAELTPEQVASIEAEIETKLRPEDLKPTFHIAFGEDGKPVGLVLLLTIEGPNGAISGGVGLDMTGKVVKVQVHKHSEAAGIADETFLKQFSEKGVEDKFKIGEDIEPVAGEEAASQAVALMPKKTLAISYALFLKRPDTPDEDVAETYEPEDLKEVMMMMKDEYDLIRTYLRGGKNSDKEAAIKAAKQLEKYTKFIADFEPPKNPNDTEGYTYFQKKFDDAIREFAQHLETEGISETTQKQWQEIVELVNTTHLRFSVEDIDLDEDLN